MSKKKQPTEEQQAVLNVYSTALNVALEVEHINSYATLKAFTMGFIAGVANGKCDLIKMLVDTALEITKQKGW